MEDIIFNQNLNINTTNTSDSTPYDSFLTCKLVNHSSNLAESPNFHSQIEEFINIEKYLENKFFTQDKVEEIFKKFNLLKEKDKEFEKEFVKKVVDHIEIVGNIPTDKSNNTGSLLSLFNSYIFDMSMMLYYIDKRQERGILDTLINVMYQRFIDESFFYLPQLCTMLTYKTQTDSLENYLLDRCVNQMKFSLKIHWLVESYYETEANPKISKLFDDLLQKIETTLVNGRRCTLSNYSQYQKIKKSEENVIKHSIYKELRLRYFEVCVEFYKKLKQMCEKLKSFPKESNRPNNRTSILKDYVFMHNTFIRSLKDDIPPGSDSLVKNFYKGIILPFDDYFSTMDEHNSIIVRILPEHCFCFSTKARVPTKMTVECVRVIECCKWDELYLEGKNEKNETSFNQILLNDDQLPEDSFKLHENENVKSLNEFMKEIKDPKNLKEENSTNRKEENDLVTYEFNPDVINPFGRKWSEVVKEIKETSPFRNFETYSIKNFIAKADDDLRQELMTMQMIKKFSEIFSKAQINLKIRPYEILITSSSSGLIEFLPNTNSIDGIKKKLPPHWNLNTFYRNFFSESFEEVQKNFAESLAAYSLISYYLQIKDRHNGNILIDMQGNIIHIDFGFILGINPGNLNFESAPFKLTREYIEILDGMNSPMFDYYKSLMLRGMIEAKKHIDGFVKIVEIMTRGAKMPCFENTDINAVVNKFRERFHEKGSDNEYKKIIEGLIYSSYDNFWTSKYDSYQKLTNGILP